MPDHSEGALVHFRLLCGDCQEDGGFRGFLHKVGNVCEETDQALDSVFNDDVNLIAWVDISLA